MSAWWDSWCHLWQTLGWCISRDYRDNGPARDVPDHDDPNDSPYTDPVL